MGKRAKESTRKNKSELWYLSWHLYNYDSLTPLNARLNIYSRFNDSETHDPETEANKLEILFPIRTYQIVHYFVHYMLPFPHEFMKNLSDLALNQTLF